MRRLLSPIEQVLHGPRGQAVTVEARVLVRLVILVVTCGSLYGAVMGSFGGLFGERALQILISASKVPILLVVTFAVSIPSFFVLNTLLGLRDDFPHVLRALIGSQAGLTIILVSLSGYTLLWYASFTNYHNAILFNGVMFGFATFAAQILLWKWYRPLIARDARHRLMLVVWLVIYSFVGIQLGWVLRPFIGQPGTPVQFFRDEAWGNAYVVVWRMMWNALTR